MKIMKYILLPITVLALSGAAAAKQPNNHGNQHNESPGPDARLLNSNKQLESGDNLRGRDRAEERQEINQTIDHDNSRNADEPRGQPRHKR